MHSAPQNIFFLTATFQTVKAFVTTSVTPLIIDMLTFNNNRLQPFTKSQHGKAHFASGEGGQFRYGQNQVPAR